MALRCQASLRKYAALQFKYDQVRTNQPNQPNQPSASANQANP